MKSTRRHELQSNELADLLGRSILRLKPWMRPIAYAALLAGGLVFVLVVLPAIRGGQSPADRAALAYSAAQNTGQMQPLRDFLKDYPDVLQVQAARLLLAERLRAEAMTGADGAAANSAGDQAAPLLGEARDLYQQVAQSADEFEPWARTGLALLVIQEGDLEKGKTALREIVAKWSQSIAAAQARAHLESLADYQPVAFSDEPVKTPQKSEPAEPAKENPAGGKKVDLKPPEG